MLQTKVQSKHDADLVDQTVQVTFGFGNKLLDTAVSVSFWR